ncbi:MAG: TonB-dependent receptor [Gammaproteobacteria bacterium]|nr:TonB-dependent receptor [Gammaproteobacteria bacterium]
MQSILSSRPRRARGRWPASWSAGLCCGLLAAALPVAAAQEAGNLEKIIVTGTRLEHSLRDVPAAVEVVTEDDIQTARQQISLAESLSPVPGLLLQNRYNFALGLRVAIRGFGTRANFGVRGIKILIDGIPETLPDGQASADSIDLGATSRIEVIRGPSSTLYGNASGGVINVTTELPPEGRFAAVALGGGELGFKRAQVKAGGHIDRVGYLLSATDWRYDGYREHSFAKKRDLTGRFNIDLGSARALQVTASYGRQPLSLDPGGVTAAAAAETPTAARPANVTFNARQHYEQTRLGFVYDSPIGRHITVTARNYYVWRDFMQYLPYQAGGVPAFERFFAGGGLSLTHQGTWLDRPNRLAAGFDFERQQDDRSRYDNDFGTRGVLSLRQDETVTSRGLYVQDELSITPRLVLTLGARYDDVGFDVDDRFLSDGDDSGRVTNSSTSPTVAIAYMPAPIVTLYARYSTSFEVPTTSEYARPDGSGGFNQSLEPQLSSNYEVGMRGVLASRHQYALALYATSTRDELIPFEVPGSPGHDYFVNAGRSARNGLEFSLQSRLSRRWRTAFSYTYSDFSFKRYVNADGVDFSGNTLPGTAREQAYAQLAFEDPRGWFGALDALYIGRQYADDANTAASAGYTLADVRLGYRHASDRLDVTPYIAVNNLLDRRHNANVRINSFGGRFYEAGPGRNVYAGVSAKYHY